MIDPKDPASTALPPPAPSPAAADDRLGPEEQTPLPTPLWQSLVRVLTNHIAALDNVTQRVTAVRDHIALKKEVPGRAELEELGRSARAQADTATDVARAIEGIDRRRGDRRRGRHA